MQLFLISQIVQLFLISEILISDIRNSATISDIRNKCPVFIFNALCCVASICSSMVCMFFATLLGNAVVSPTHVANQLTKAPVKSRRETLKLISIDTVVTGNIVRDGMMLLRYLYFVL